MDIYICIESSSNDEEETVKRSEGKMHVTTVENDKNDKRTRQNIREGFDDDCDKKRWSTLTKNTDMNKYLRSTDGNRVLRSEWFI